MLKAHAIARRRSIEAVVTADPSPASLACAAMDALGSAPTGDQVQALGSHGTIGANASVALNISDLTAASSFAIYCFAHNPLGDSLPSTPDRIVALPVGYMNTT